MGRAAMDSSDWQRLEDLFHTASDLDPAARRALLEERRATEPELVAEVESLLSSGEAVGDHLEQAIGDGFRLAAKDAEQEPERRRIGSYRVLGELGRGGLSVVYLAERDDDAYRKEVAIKVVKRGMDTREILLRLHQERQIMASLDHPYIARLLDGGSTEDGLPYFVMERIRGQPIDDYCDHQKLSIHQRLELFRKVCSAVQFAHQNLVIHRDIKPGNLLVTEEGTPKLLDFGIAKLLDPEHPAAAFTATATGLRLLTPSYASPEQIQGHPLTTATDVYSLGVLLYRLLTGQPPYRFMTRGPAEMERVICDQVPDRPSSIVLRANEPTEAESPSAPSAPSGRGQDPVPARRARQLRGDLDKIVLMALRKEPQRRYPSVEQFSADIRRYLRNLPVTACRDTFAYRSRKFIRRHRIALAAGFLVLSSLLAGLATTLWQAQRAQRNFEAAEMERAKGQRVSEFLIDLFKVSDPDRSLGATITAREILDQGADRIRQELTQEPGLRAALMDVMGTVYHNLGLYDQAEALLTESLELNRSTHGQRHLSAATGWSHLAALRKDQGDFEQADLLFRRALDLYRQLLDAPDARIAEALNDLAAARSALEDQEGAESLFRQALEMRIDTLEENHPEISETRNNLAVVLYLRGNLPEAEELLRQALAARRIHFGNVHPRIASTLNNLAALLQRQQRNEEAKEMLREVVAMREKMLGPDHRELALSLNNLAASQRSLGAYDEAEQNFRRAIQITRRAQGENFPDVATMQINLANLLVERGDAAEAPELYRAAVQIRRDNFGPADPRLVNPLIRLARAELETKPPGTATPQLQRVIELLADDPDNPLLAEARCLLGDDLLAAGQPAAATEAFQSCLPDLIRTRGENDPLVAASRRHLDQLRGDPT